MNKLVIVGASGHGKVVADIAVLNGYKHIVFLDDNLDLKECLGFPVVGRSTEAPGGDVFVAIGKSEIRKKLTKLYDERKQPILVHPAATIASDVEIGAGSVVMAGAVINPGARIGKGCIINTGSSVDHDCNVSDFCHISVGAHLCGAVNIGEETWIGAGAIVNNNINVCKCCVIGAGAVVVKDIAVPETYVGVPARLLNYNY